MSGCFRVPDHLPLQQERVDGRKTSIGVGGAVGPINAPTVFNSVFNVEQFWDGRAATLQDQAGGPPLNPIEMASKSWDEIIAKLEKDPQLKAQFLEVYPQGFSGENITDAIAEFEKTLITPDSPFDKCLLLEDEKISKACAEALYMGIAHDTGVFQYSCTSPETMEAAAQLLRKGIDGSEIIEKTYFEKTYIQNQILGRALLESMLVLEKQVVVSVVSRKEMEFFEAVPSDLEGIVAQLRQTKGVEVAIFLHETDTREYKVSLRSKGKVNVSSIAQYFGGGGHVRAAGVTMKGSAHDVINNLLRQITLQLKEA